MDDDTTIVVPALLQALEALAVVARYLNPVGLADNDSGTRGRFSLYVPEYYGGARAWPLVVALHGGSGNGRAFLWSWLRDARSRGAILASPTATGRTWALLGDDTDTPNLMRM